jgi:hypothetical protein
MGQGLEIKIYKPKNNPNPFKTTIERFLTKFLNNQ